MSLMVIENGKIVQSLQAPLHNDTLHVTSAKRNAANGIAGLDASAKVPDANLESPVATHNTDVAHFFGGGAQGNVTISANTTLSNTSFYKNLTVNSGIVLKPNSFLIFVSNTFTNNGTIAARGIDSPITNELGGGGNGGAASCNQAGIAGSPGSSGGAGGNGGVTAVHAKGVGGAANDKTKMAVLYGLNANLAGGGGGGGSNDASGAGCESGAGGMGGGTIVIFSSNLVNNGSFSVVGAPGTNGNGGDGGGGGGGYIMLVYITKTGTGNILLTGGAAGADGTPTAGETGNLREYVV